MTNISCVLFDCDGTLVDSETLYCEAYIVVCALYGVHINLEEAIKRFKGIKLYQIFDNIRQQYGIAQSIEVLERQYCQEVARLFNFGLKPIEGIRTLLEQIMIPIAVVSNGPFSKIKHSLELTSLLPFFNNRLFSGYTVGHWKPDPALIYYAAEEMSLPVESCILIEDSLAGAQAGIAAGIPVFYYCTDTHNPPLDHPLVTCFDAMAQLPALWHKRGWIITHTLASLL
ncbi:MAG: 6-phosphogluconate phosphatase [Sodalis sp. (in: enterobacteria)]